MLEEGHFVGNMKYPMETNATLLNVNTIELQILWHANSTKQSGENTSLIIVVQV